MNHLNQLLKLSIETMLTSNDWTFPPHWNREDCLRFIDSAQTYLERTEQYEECKMLQDVKEKI